MKIVQCHGTVLLIFSYICTESNKMRSNHIFASPLACPTVDPTFQCLCTSCDEHTLVLKRFS